MPGSLSTRWAAPGSPAPPSLPAPSAARPGYAPPPAAPQPGAAALADSVAWWRRGKGVRERLGGWVAGRLGGCGSARTLFSGSGAVGAPLTRLLSSPKGSRGERGAGGEAGRKGEQVTGPPGPSREQVTRPPGPSPRTSPGPVAALRLDVFRSRFPGARPAAPGSLSRSQPPSSEEPAFSSPFFLLGSSALGAFCPRRWESFTATRPLLSSRPAVISEIPVVGLAVLVALRRPAALAGPRVQAPGDGAGLTPRSVAGLTAASPWSTAHAARSAPQPPPRPPCRWPCPCFSFSSSRLPSPVASPCHARLSQSCS